MDRIAESIATLRRCAALELPRLLDELGKRFQIDAWRDEAQQRGRALSSGR
jgi:hypothetical protein